MSTQTDKFELLFFGGPYDGLMLRSDAPRAAAERAWARAWYDVFKAGQVGLSMPLPRPTGPSRPRRYTVTKRTQGRGRLVIELTEGDVLEIL